MIKNVFITGVTGQDGAWMVKYLLEKTPHNVFGLKRRTSSLNNGSLGSLLKNPRFTILECDVTDPISVNSIFEKNQVDYFINFAANSFVGNSWSMPHNHQEINFLGVLNILEAMRVNAPKCRLYNAGSSEEWGDVVYSPQDENHPMRPRSPYGVSKCAARLMIKVYRESYGLYAIQGHLLNHESEIRGEEFVTRKITKFVAKLKKAMIDGSEYPSLELGNLSAKRDWSHAFCFVDGVFRMLNQDSFREMQNISKEIKEYVLASGEAHEIREFLKLALDSAKIHDYKFSGEGINETVAVDDKIIVKISEKFYRPAEVELLHGDASLAKKELFWTPKIGFKQLVDLMVTADLKREFHGGGGEIQIL